MSQSRNAGVAMASLLILCAVTLACCEINLVTGNTNDSAYYANETANGSSVVAINQLTNNDTVTNVTNGINTSDDTGTNITNLTNTLGNTDTNVTNTSGNTVTKVTNLTKTSGNTDTNVTNVTNTSGNTFANVTNVTKIPGNTGIMASNGTNLDKVSAGSSSSVTRITNSGTNAVAGYDFSSRSYNSHKQIRIDVFDKYVPAIPVINGQGMQVRLNLQMVMLVDVNEPEEAILLNGWIMVFWKDESLQWDPKRYNSTQAEFPSAAKLWVPDVTWYERIPLVEAYESDAGIFSGARALVKNTGEIYVSRGLLMKSHCALSVHYFPFDRQECNFTFSSNLHTIDRLHLRPPDNRRESLSDTEGWTMLGFPVRSYNKTFKDVGTFTRVVFTLKMRRKPMFYVFYLMLPSFLISVLSCFVFILPPQSSEKVPFCVSILLSLTVFMMIMTGLTPPTQEVPLLSIYFFVVLLLSMLNAASVILIENVYDSDGVISSVLYKLCIWTCLDKSDRQCVPTLHTLAPGGVGVGVTQYSDGEGLNGCDGLDDDERRASKRNRRRMFERKSGQGRVNAVKRLNRICFTFSISCSLVAPALFTMYGYSEH